MRKIFPLLLILCLLLPLIGCKKKPEYVDPMSKFIVPIPMYPNARLTARFEKEVAGVPRGTPYDNYAVFFKSEDSADAILEFFKENVTSVDQVLDRGGYYAVIIIPEGWQIGERIEIRIEKKDTGDEPNFSIEQFKRKK